MSIGLTTSTGVYDCAHGDFFWELAHVVAILQPSLFLLEENLALPVGIRELDIILGKRQILKMGLVLALL